MNIYEEVNNVRSREDLVEFLEVFASGQICHDEALEDMSAQEYLLSIASWIEDMDGYYENNNLEIPKNINWNFIANILYAGKVYE